MPKFLLNANLSRETKDFLKILGYEAETVAKFSLGKAKDQEIVKFAQKHGYIIITLDMDFGEIYYFASQPPIGIVILKLKNQTIESVNNSLKTLHKIGVLEKKQFQKSLIIFNGKKVRVTKK